MKARFNTGNVTFELESDTPKSMFKLLARMQDVFGESCCGACKKKDLRFFVRTIDGNDYYEMVCNDCGARLQYGQSKKEANLYPKRRVNKEGQIDMKNGVYDSKSKGWTYYKGVGKDEDEQYGT